MPEANEQLRQAFHDAYAGEAKAVIRLKLYAEKADAEGYPQIAHLFRAIAASEEIHGVRFLRLLRSVGTTEENLAASFASETSVAGVTYQQFITLAEQGGNRAAATVFAQNRDVEAVHARLYEEAMGHVMEARTTTYHICKVCGYVSDGVVPDVCPVCNATREQFVQI